MSSERDGRWIRAIDPAACSPRSPTRRRSHRAQGRSSRDAGSRAPDRTRRSPPDPRRPGRIGPRQSRALPGPTLGLVRIGGDDPIDDGDRPGRRTPGRLHVIGEGVRRWTLGLPPVPPLGETVHIANGEVPGREADQHGGDQREEHQLPRGVAGSTRSRNLSTSEALISLAIPPGDSSAKALWSRHTNRVRSRPISTLRLANNRSTSRWSAGATSRRPRWRSAVIATDKASLGSVFADRPVANTRSRHQCRRHINNVLAGGDKLLGQQIPQPVGRLDGPTPRLERLGPSQELFDLAAAGSDLPSSELGFGAVDRDGGVAGLVGINPDDDHAHWSASSSAVVTTARGIPVCGPSARSSLEPPRSQIPTGALFDRKPNAPTASRQALREQPRPRPRDATATPQRLPLTQTGTSVMPEGCGLLEPQPNRLANAPMYGLACLAHVGVSGSGRRSTPRQDPRSARGMDSRHSN